MNIKSETINCTFMFKSGKMSLDVQEIEEHLQSLI